MKRGPYPKDEPWRPANGTEGDLFEVQYCEQCKHNDDGYGCEEIFGKALFHDEDEPEYPKELVGGESGWGECTKFEKETK